MVSEYIANLKIKQYGGSFISCPSSWAATHVTSSYHKLYIRKYRRNFQMVSEYIANLKIKQYGGSFISCPSSWAATHVTSSYHKLYFPVSGEARITYLNILQT